MLRFAVGCLLVGVAGSLLGCSSEDKTSSSDDSSAESDTTDESSEVDDAPNTDAGPAGEQPASSSTGEPGAPAGPASSPSSTASTAPSSSATVPVAPSTPPDPNLGTVGASCESDAQCQVGLTCLTDGSFFTGESGTIARGLCTARCEQNPYLCQNYSSQATCILTSGGTEDTADDEGLCVEQCVVGDGSLKCQGNPDQVCLPLQDSFAICVPFCLDDLGCAAGQFCDPTSGLCVEDAPPGAGYGEPCEANEECVGGGCLFATEEQPSGLCSGPCTITNLVVGCGFSGEEGAVPDALCLPAAEGLGVGDPGLCAPLCDSDADCHLDQLYCDVLGDAELEAALGRRGFCLPDEIPTADAGTPVSDDPPAADDGPTLDAGAELPSDQPDAASAGGAGSQ